MQLVPIIPKVTGLNPTSNIMTNGIVLLSKTVILYSICASDQWLSSSMDAIFLRSFSVSVVGTACVTSITCPIEKFPNRSSIAHILLEVISMWSR